MNYLQLDNYPNFYITVQDNLYESDKLKKLLDFILIEYELLFSKEILCKSECVISNHINKKYPQYIYSGIHLTVPSYYHYCKTTYQISHELLHYIFHQTSNGLPILSWFEETLCEAFSLYILNFCSDKWSDCLISKEYLDGKVDMLNYSITVYNTITTTGLKRCKNIYDLIFINKTSEEDRIQRVIERNYVFNLFKIYRDDIPLITEYRKYIKSEVLIDFDKWIKDTNNNEFIIELSKIQPKIN